MFAILLWSPQIRFYRIWPVYERWTFMCVYVCVCVYICVYKYIRERADVVKPTFSFAEQ